jgi:predicted Zn-dependent protease
MIRITWFIIILTLFFCAGIYAQDSRLANQYYQSGEYEKAAELYNQLYTKSNSNDYYFRRYIDALLALEEYEQCEKAIAKQLKKKPNNVELYVTRGTIYERKGFAEKAENEYQRAITMLPVDQNIIYSLGNSFLRLTKYDYALKAYEKGEKLLDNANIFAYQMADLYRRKGDSENMIQYFLRSLNQKNARISNVKTYFDRNLQKENFDELTAQIYEKIQEYPENLIYPELLEWVFIQQKNYAKALRQSKALDRRLDENGVRVYNIAQIAANDRDYKTAIDAYTYLIQEKGPNTSFYIDAKREMLNCKRKRITQNYDYTQEDLLSLRAEYQAFLEEIGWNKQSALLVSELARFEAIYMNDLDRAIELLSQMIEYPGVNRYILANGKISLADYYLMKSDIWEATLLYSQVDKAFKEEYLGEQARYKNAKLSYYNGDFEWAQAQFDILKASTSKLISNDAIDLSIFIMDNLNLDTIDTPLRLYSQAELLTVQNRFDDAFIKLDSIQQVFPEHSLEDDILYAKAHIYVQKKEFDQAEVMYQQIIDNFKEEIRCDNAIYELAELYEGQLAQPDKAKALYESLFMDYTNSTFAVEARKRFRALRGDNLQ